MRHCWSGIPSKVEMFHNGNGEIHNGGSIIYAV